MRNSKTPKGAVVERIGSDSAVLSATSRRSVYAGQLCAVASGNFRNVLALARGSQLESWLCLDDDRFWGFKSPAYRGRTFSVGVKSPLQNVIANCKSVVGTSPLQIANWFNLGTVLATRESFSTKVTQVGIEPGDEV